MQNQVSIQTAIGSKKAKLNVNVSIQTAHINTFEEINTLQTFNVNSMVNIVSNDYPNDEWIPIYIA